jgi:hypothetical protein
MLAILHAIKKWHPYLIGRHFKVIIDHDSLKYFLEQQLTSKEKQKWVTKMLGYGFEIIYKKGKHNMVENALSRKEEEIEGLLCVISILQSDWMEEARIEWKQDQKVCKIIRQLQENPRAFYKFVWKNDLLWYRDHLLICCGIEIAYIYVRIPNSNRRSFGNCTLLLYQVNVGKRSQWILLQVSLYPKERMSSW